MTNIFREPSRHSKNGRRKPSPDFKRSRLLAELVNCVQAEVQIDQSSVIVESGDVNDMYIIDASDYDLDDNPNHVITKTTVG